MALRLVASVGAAILLAACQSTPTKPIEVRIPVPVRATPPPELVACGQGLPLPTFEACGKDGWSCLKPAQEPVLRDLLHGLASCNEGWRAWATSSQPDP